MAVGLLALFVCVSLAAAQTTAEDPLDNGPILDPAEQDVLNMDLEQLSRADVVLPAMDMVVTSVSRQESTVGQSPTAIYVITPEMIRRSGANNIPDLLRMVPGVQVAQIDANKWAISIRGFNGRFSDKLLVQIDGRAVYSQFFSGVFWDVQDLPLQDIERIEVIRGPGATVWGANAVNGVINIITKQAKDTQGVLISGGTGNEERGFSTVRYGGQWGEDTYWRVYGKQFERDGEFTPDDPFDDWRQARGGFRVDMTPSCSDFFTLQGDFYDGISGESDLDSFPSAPFMRDIVFDDHALGQNFLTRWTKVLDDDTDWSLQVYYDRAARRSERADMEQRTFDVDYQYRCAWRDIHNVICGAGYRQIDDHLFGTFNFSLDPPYKNTNLFTYFIQDQIELEEDRWYVTFGSKFEHNDFTGFEYQPTARLLFLPSDRETMWAAVSRAVRTPSRIDQYSVTNRSVSDQGPIFTRFLGDRGFVSEELMAYEMGYRAQPIDEFSWDVAVFYNDYDKLTSISAPGMGFVDPTIPGFVVPIFLENGTTANSYGFELASAYQVHTAWEVSGSYSLLYIDAMNESVPGSLSGSSPHNQLFVRSSWDLRRDLEFDLIGRYVDNLPALDVSKYVTMDARLAWRPRKNFEWAVVGRNLLDKNHSEFVDAVGGTIGTEVQTEVFTTVTWTH
jgi:iron complex outermembrane receptor protein